MPQYSGMWTLSQVSQAVKNQTWTGLPPSVVEYLVVAGGGGGGKTGGGGGAGGLLAGFSGVTTGSAITVTVGAGGGGSVSQSDAAFSGSNSVFGNFTASGGGGAGSNSSGSGVNGPGVSGGSGGGVASTGNAGGVPGSGITGQGNAGGYGTVTGTGYPAGGGGGAGTVGLSGVGGTTSGNGGAGIASAISGSVVTYAGGGGGGSQGQTAGAGGAGGGGSGTNNNTTGTAGTTNTGGGGGGGGFGTNYANGGAGGSGVVIIRYPGTTQFFTGGTLSYANGYMIHTFYANGTLVPIAGTLYANPDYQIARSLRFNSADSAYLNRTPATTTNRTTWTWSGWVKRVSFGSSQVLFGAGPDGSNYTILYFGGTLTDSLEIFNYTSGVTTGYAYTTSVFRDPSAWYHVVLAVDTTQATSADRTKIYVNGVLQTITISTTFASNVNTWVNTNNSHRLGSTPTTSTFNNGYMTDVNFIDGQALTPSSFGWTNPATGVWAPLDFVGTYGTNGFNLNFSDNTNTTAATLGADSSGNGNNWTPNNFSVTTGAGNDSLVDSPTLYGTDTGVGGEVRGNYATLNSVRLPASVTLSNGNLDVSTGNTSEGATGTIAVNSGKWYWETTFNTQTSGNTMIVGVVNSDTATTFPTGTNGFGYYGSSGNKYGNGGDASYGATYTTGDIIGVAIDIDNGKIWWSKNGTFQASGDPVAGTNAAYTTNIAGRSWMPSIGTGAGTITASSNFGQRPFAYTAPSGYKALNTQNLPTPTIGATSATLAGKYFNTVLYTGNGATQTIGGVGFQPDFVWYKSRSSAVYNHGLFDSVRGVTKQLFSNTTGAEDTYSGVTAFNSGGFTVGSDAGGNESGGSMVAWNWRASNATAVSNTAGSITSTVSASTTSGFSIITYTGTGSAGATVGHGLGAVPSMIIFKKRSGTSDWQTYHTSLGNANSVYLNLTNASAASSGMLNSTTPTSTLITLGTSTDTNPSAGTMVAYCFAPIAGYSAFGSYTGNGSADGPFVHLGFRPAFWILKRTDTTGEWFVFDSARDTYNAVGNYLKPYGSAAEATFASVDFLSNGFKIRNAGFSSNGGTFIYMAFASNPFKYSLAR